MSAEISAALATPADFEMLNPNGTHETPTVTLDADDVSQEMAARLTIALLGQLLYMKGQVPFPISSLSKMSREGAEYASRASKRAEKRRLEFIDSYDDLTSHLHTTFVALSTALAKNEDKYPIFSPTTSTPSVSTQHKLRDTFYKTRRPSANVHILFVLGPSPSTAKARYLLELDGFRVEQFGEWEHSCRDRHRAEREHCSSKDEDEPVTITSSSQRSTPSTSPRKPPSGYADGWQTPSSSSSQHSYASGSVPSSPSATSSGSQSDSDDEASSEMNLPALSQSAEEASLRAGERLLFRALFASGDNIGFGDEISPTQVHVLIRAPRRFTHPTWVPRQSLGSMLDRQVQYFLESESCPNTAKSTRQLNNAGFGVGLYTVGVRVKCREKGNGRPAVKPSDVVVSRGVESEEVEPEEDDAWENENEEDELIWWSWDGKLVGFSD